MFVLHEMEVKLKFYFNRIVAKRDSSNEVPADFGDDVNKWALESIICIFLNRRLGILSGGSDENAQKLIKFSKELSESGFEFEVTPTLWRIYETKAFKRLMEVSDGITK